MITTELAAAIHAVTDDENSMHIWAELKICNEYKELQCIFLQSKSKQTHQIICLYKTFICLSRRTVWCVFQSFCCGLMWYRSVKIHFWNWKSKYHNGVSNSLQWPYPTLIKKVMSYRDSSDSIITMKHCSWHWEILEKECNVPAVHWWGS